MADQATLSGMSMTGIGVAAARAEESERADRLFDDPMAAAFVAAAGPGAPESANEATPYIGGYFALRTRFFDDQLLAATAAGCRQVVQLAAGLDTRAYRLPVPADAVVFELDRPDVLAFKQQVLDGRGDRPRCTRHPVGTDLLGDWAGALDAAGFDPARPTAWIAEGIMPYLTVAANDELLATVTGRSAPGSWLAFEHVNNATLEHPWVRPVLDIVAGLGAPWQSAVDDPVGWLADAGWAAEVHPAVEVAAALGRPVPPALDPAVMGEARGWWVAATRG